MATGVNAFNLQTRYHPILKLSAAQGPIRKFISEDIEEGSREPGALTSPSSLLSLGLTGSYTWASVWGLDKPWSGHPDLSQCSQPHRLVWLDSDSFYGVRLSLIWFQAQARVLPN